MLDGDLRPMVDTDGKDISGNFEAQVRRVFALMDQTLKRAGGSLANLVTMTGFIKDPHHGDRFVEMRRQMFPDGTFPASALITVTGFLVSTIALLDSVVRPGYQRLSGAAVSPLALLAGGKSHEAARSPSLP
jgi:hypothetical protein